MRNALMPATATVIGLVVAVTAIGMPLEPAAILAAMCGLAVFVPLAEAEREAEWQARITRSRREWADRLAADVERRERADREARRQEARDRAAEHERPMAEWPGDPERIPSGCDAEFESTVE